MKRNELKVGTTYAVLAPSQQPGKSWRSGRKVTVVDTEPLYVDTYDSWSRRDPAMVAAHNAEGKPVMAEDHVRKVDAASDYRSPEAKRSVLVVEEDEPRYGRTEPRYRLRAVPLSNVRMTWAEYEAEVADYEARREAAWKAREAADRAARARTSAAIAERDTLNAVLDGTDVTAKVVDGEVVLAGPVSVLRALIETANDSAFRATA